MILPRDNAYDMALDPQKTTPLVIDVQNEYFDGQWPIPDGQAALYRIEQGVVHKPPRHSTMTPSRFQE